MDLLYTAVSGVPLDHKTAPVYIGHMYQWRSSRDEIRKSAIDALLRVRRNASVGVHAMTHFTAMNYFASIWPAGLGLPDGIEWPRHLKRSSLTEHTI